MTRLVQTSRRRALRLGRQESGSAAIETALSYMLVMTCVLGIIECSMMVYTYSVYADAARVGVRYATIHGADSSNCSGPGCTDSTGANVASAVTTYAALFTTPASGLNVTVNYPDGSCATPSRVSVTVAYTYVPLFHFPGTQAAFSAMSQGRIIY
jgi:Flp pilus assembly protein TadG